MRRNPLVLHVIPTPVARGAQREARAIADRLDSPGLRDHRVLSIFAGPEEVKVDESLDRRSKRPARGLDPSVVLQLARALSRLDPSVVVAHGGDSLKYVVPATARRRRPVLYYAIGTFSASDRRSQVALWRVLTRRADLVACEGEEVMEECATVLEIPRRKLFLTPNGRDPKEFFPRGADGREGARAPTVIFVGALNAGKGPDRFIDAVARMRARDGAPELRAVICGEGPMRAQLEEPARAAGVQMLGSRSDVAELLRDADVFLFPSRPTGEGMPGVLIEAGLSGLPAVATRVPGVATIVGDGKTGFLVEVDDTDAMARQGALLIDDAQLRREMGSSARERCAEQFGIEKVAELWLSLIERLLADQRSR